jgi:hypothetical protein
MVYELPPITGTSESTTTHGRFLEGLLSEPLTPAEIQRQEMKAEQMREAISGLYRMDRISQKARLHRQNGLDSYGFPIKPYVGQDVREPELVSA